MKETHKFVRDTLEGTIERMTVKIGFIFGVSGEKIKGWGDEWFRGI